MWGGAGACVSRCVGVCSVWAVLLESVQVCQVYLSYSEQGEQSAVSDTRCLTWWPQVGVPALITGGGWLELCRCHPAPGPQSHAGLRGPLLPLVQQQLWELGAVRVPRWSRAEAQVLGCLGP